MATADSTKVLFERWRDGDEDAAAAVYGRYSDRLLALAERQISAQLARRVGPDDIVQSVLRTMFRRVRDGRLQIDRSNALWQLLVRITLNKIRRQAERHHAEKRSLNRECLAGDADSILESLQDRQPAADDVLALSEEIERCLAGLSPQDALIVRFALEGHGALDIARRVGRSRWTVRRVLDRIGRQLETRVHPDVVD